MQKRVVNAKDVAPLTLTLVWTFTRSTPNFARYTSLLPLYNILSTCKYDLLGRDVSHILVREAFKRKRWTD
jgi:hypothetical protein